MTKLQLANRRTETHYPAKAMTLTDEQILTLSPFSVVMMMAMNGGRKEGLDKGAELLGKLIDKEFTVSSPLLSHKID
ncbi:MAG: hypothetical protein AAGA30_20865, partial [Planctomycetota bacterium]